MAQALIVLLVCVPKRRTGYQLGTARLPESHHPQTDPVSTGHRFLLPLRPSAQGSKAHGEVPSGELSEDRRGAGSSGGRAGRSDIIYRGRESRRQLRRSPEAPHWPEGPCAARVSAIGARRAEARGTVTRYMGRQARRNRRAAPATRRFIRRIHSPSARTDPSMGMRSAHSRCASQRMDLSVRAIACGRQVAGLHSSSSDSPCDFQRVGQRRLHGGTAAPGCESPRLRHQAQLPRRGFPIGEFCPV